MLQEITKHKCDSLITHFHYRPQQWWFKDAPGERQHDGSPKMRLSKAVQGSISTYTLNQKAVIGCSVTRVLLFTNSHWSQPSHQAQESRGTTVKQLVKAMWTELLIVSLFWKSILKLYQCLVWKTNDEIHKNKKMECKGVRPLKNSTSC